MRRELSAAVDGVQPNSHAGVTMATLSNAQSAPARWPAALIRWGVTAPVAGLWVLHEAMVGLAAAVPFAGGDSAAIDGTAWFRWDVAFYQAIARTGFAHLPPYYAAYFPGVSVYLWLTHWPVLALLGMQIVFLVLLILPATVSVFTPGREGRPSFDVLDFPRRARVAARTGGSCDGWLERQRRGTRLPRPRPPLCRTRARGCHPKHSPGRFQRLAGAGCRRTSAAHARGTTAGAR
jgi:hypothetical protein